MATAAKLDPKLEALGLAPRVLDVLALLLHGHSNKAIANHLGISPNTVTGYVSTILKRLEVSSRSQVPAEGASAPANSPRLGPRTTAGGRRCR